MNGRCFSVLADVSRVLSFSFLFRLRGPRVVFMFFCIFFFFSLTPLFAWCWFHKCYHLPITNAVYCRGRCWAEGVGGGSLRCHLSMLILSPSGHRVCFTFVARAGAPEMWQKLMLWRANPCRFCYHNFKHLPNMFFQPTKISFSNQPGNSYWINSSRIQHVQFREKYFTTITAIGWGRVLCHVAPLEKKALIKGTCRIWRGGDCF